MLIHARAGRCQPEKWFDAPKYSAAICLVIILCVSASNGCAKRKNVVDKKPTKEELALKARKEIPGEISGRVWTIKWFKRSVKGNKALKLELVSYSSEGSITDPQNPTVLLHDVRAEIFLEGIHTATITADTMRGNQQEHELVATGHARVVSLTNPPDTVVTANTITFNTNTNIMIASGHATAMQKGAGNKTSFTQGDRLRFDSRLKEMRND